jgi:hypothetical protein
MRLAALSVITTSDTELVDGPRLCPLPFCLGEKVRRQSHVGREIT